MKSGILSPPTAMDLETRLEIGDDTKEIRQGGYNGIKVEVNVVGSDIRRERFGSLSRFLARVLRTHVAGTEDAASKMSVKFNLNIGKLSHTCRVPGLC